MGQALIIIPARMQATRLPGKPMAEIDGEPMILHVWRRAKAAEAGRVVVATEADEIFETVRKAGGEAVMTRDDHRTGSDRVFEAMNRVDPDDNAEYIVNLQGDLPLLEPHLVRQVIEPLREKGPHIATLAAPIRNDAQRDNPNVVKVVGTPIDEAGQRLRALYFTRVPAPYGEGGHYHHIGIYGYRRTALERFASLSPSPLERREKLEQLRGLENGMRIDAVIVDTLPLAVDTPADLERVREIAATSPGQPT